MTRHDNPLTEGLQAGLIGAALVAAWFLALNTLTGAHPLATPAALGELVMNGPAAVSDGVTVRAATVLGYTAMHVAAFIAFGLAMAGAARVVERRPPLLAVVLLPFMMLEAFFYGGLLGAGPLVFGPGHLFAVGVANLLATIGMGTWIWRRHPSLRRRATDEHVMAPFSKVYPLPLVEEDEERAAS